MPENAWLRRGLRARRGRDREPRSYRLANSVRLPWAVGLGALVVLGLATLLLVGRSDDDPLDVPAPMRDLVQQVAADAAQDVRRSVNEGVVDVTGFARTYDAIPAQARTGRLPSVLANTFLETHGRYVAVTIRGPDGAVTAAARRPGESTAPARRPPSAMPLDGPTLLGPTPSRENVPILLQAAPLAARAGRSDVVGQYDPEFFRFALQGAEPGAAWLLDRDGRSIGMLGGVPRMVALPRQPLREAAQRALRGATGTLVTGASFDQQEVLGYAPVSGLGPAGGQGWAVVTSRTVTSFDLPQTQARRQGVLVGVVLLVLAVVIFGWLYIVVLRPILRLQREAERIAYGDLSRSVEVIRYDEIGLIARALERVRVLLIRTKVKGARGESDPERVDT